MVDLSRRQILASIGASATLPGSSLVGRVAAKDQTTDHEINKLEGGDKGKLLGEIHRDDVFKAIKKEVMQDGWKPSPSETKCFEAVGENVENYKYASIVFSKKA